MSNLTLDYLKSILHYDPETGLFTRVSIRNRKHKIGEIAGTLDAKGYIRIGIDGRYFRAHRLAWFYMTGEWPKDEIDHENLNKSNNEWVNLREATNQQNKHNRPQTIKNKLGVKGVHLKENKFIAQIQHNKKIIYLGSFDTLEDASEAYQIAAKNLFSDFAW